MFSHNLLFILLHLQIIYTKQSKQLAQYMSPIFSTSQDYDNLHVRTIFRKSALMRSSHIFPLASTNSHTCITTHHMLYRFELAKIHILSHTQILLSQLLGKMVVGVYVCRCVCVGVYVCILLYSSFSFFKCHIKLLLLCIQYINVLNPYPLFWT